MADASANTPRVLNIADASAPQAIPKLSGDLRPLIPPLGLHNYWYPAISAARVGSKHPVQPEWRLLIRVSGEGQKAAMEDLTWIVGCATLM